VANESKDKARIASAEMKLIRRTVKYINFLIDYKRNGSKETIFVGQFLFNIVADELNMLTDLQTIKKLQTTWRTSFKETFWRLRLERVNKWPNILAPR
jgi:hypothetical protein